MNENNKDVVPKEEKDKHLALWLGVIFFSLLIFSLWLANAKNIFFPWGVKEEVKFNIENFTKDFKDSLKESSGRMEDFKQTPVEAAKEVKEQYEEK